MGQNRKSGVGARTLLSALHSFAWGRRQPTKESMIPAKYIHVIRNSRSQLLHFDKDSFSLFAVLQGLAHPRLTGPASQETPMRFEMIWEFRLPKRRRVGVRRPVVWKDRIYVVVLYEKKQFRASELIAFADDGLELWRVEVDHVAHEPIIAEDGTVFFSDMGGTIRALGTDGATLWSTKMTPVGGRGNIWPYGLFDRCLLFRETNIGEFGKAHTWALSAEDGRVLWCTDDQRRVVPIVTGSNVLVDSSRGGLQAIDVLSGQVLWRKDTEQIIARWKVVSGLVCVHLSQGITLLELASGAVVGVLEIPGSAIRRRSPLGIDGRLLFYDTTGRVWLAGRDSSKFRILWSDVSSGRPMKNPYGLRGIEMFGVLADAAPLGMDHAATLAHTGEFDLWNLEGKHILDGDRWFDEGESGALCYHSGRLYAALGRELFVVDVVH